MQRSPYICTAKCQDGIINERAKYCWAFTATVFGHTCSVQRFLSHLNCFDCESKHNTWVRRQQFSCHWSSLFLARSWGWGLIPFQELLNNFKSVPAPTNRLMISVFPLLKLIKSIFYQHSANFKTPSKTLQIHIENIFMVLFVLASYEPRTIKLKRDLKVRDWLFKAY